MWDFFVETAPVARKNYLCDACDCLDRVGGIDEFDFDAEELAVLAKAESEDFKILKGAKHVKLKGKYNGEFMTFRARSDIDKICKDHDIYDKC